MQSRAQCTTSCQRPRRVGEGLRPKSDQVNERNNRQERRKPKVSERSDERCLIVQLRILGRSPLQQTVVRDKHAHQGAYDRVQTEISLVGEKHERECRLCQMMASGACCQRRCRIVQRKIAGFAQKILERRQQCRQDEDPDHEQRPRPGRFHSGPGHEQQSDHRSGHQTASQVVENLPSAYEREGIGDPRTVGSSGTRGKVH